MITRWRDRVIPSPVDTAAILAAYPRLVRAGDSLATACTAAIGDCRLALAGADVALEAADSALAAERARGDALARYREDLADRLEDVESRGKWRDVLVGAIGASVGYSTCKIGL